MSRTITDIIPPSRRRKLEEAGDIVPTHAPTSTTPPTPPPIPPKPLSDDPYQAPRPRKFPYITALIAFIVIAGSVAVLIAFANASVTITPRSDSATVTGEYAATFASGDLPYELVTVEKTVSSSMPAESTEEANDPAQGTITVSNAQDTPQTLIKNTRFESPDGLIYRIQTSIAIPAGSESSPGTVQATVYADSGGEQYNIAPTTFTVPGLEGTSSFELVTARSERAFEGGFSGTRASVSEETREREQEESRPELETSIAQEVQAQLKPGYVVVPGATFITYNSAPDTVGEGNTVNVNLRGAGVAVAMPQAALARQIAYGMVGSYSGQPVSLASVEGLTLAPQSEGTPTAEQQTFPFSLTGNATVTWDVDTNKIASAVAGKSREAASNILEGFPEVKRAVLNIRPFWRRSFPDDPANIEVATTSPAQ